MAEALRYLAGIGLDAVAGWEAELLAYAHAALDGLEGVRLIGRPREQAAVISFVLDDIHAHDVGTALDQAGICVRVGHHCAQPLMDLFEVPATVRASFSIYNTHAEIDALIEAIQETRKIFC